ncbi:hypothetical protein GCM10010383_04140 [Streptomyces lomondensis]|uniref:Uncharacterized protein n=1 Tax=Streptomyces lomondensis TaxID=68229 RepID=A0ABQ2WWH9_9ACTN|nr:hypothetical protein GCM10010383_04140 [Streptomyces lomondensis]
MPGRGWVAIPLPPNCPVMSLMSERVPPWHGITIAEPPESGSPEPGAHHEFEGIASSDVGARFSVAGIEWMEFTATDRQENPPADKAN